MQRPTAPQKQTSPIPAEVRRGALIRMLLDGQVPIEFQVEALLDRLDAAPR
ncbi:hypothetical protein [Jannaschia marina]|uniref:hypothetical protein n=1 Tax=Jannaschia marina TaxID=2741674 RepID=UPI0015CBE65A|nr:hypothetical protein [Jannaschia marina]